MEVKNEFLRNHIDYDIHLINEIKCISHSELYDILVQNEFELISSYKPIVEQMRNEEGFFNCTMKDLVIKIVVDNKFIFDKETNFIEGNNN